MARYGRAQPHLPIFLRAPMVAVVAATATLLPIHVIGGADTRPRCPVERKAAVVFLSPNRRSTVPPRLPVQIHVLGVSTTRPQRPIERKASIVFLSPNRRSTVPLRLAPQVQVVDVALTRPQRPIERSRASIVQLRAPAIVALLPTVTPQPKVVRAAPRSVQRTDIIMLRTPMAPAGVIPIQVHVLLQPRTRTNGVVRARVVLLRSLVFGPVGPFAAPVQRIHVVGLVAGQRVILGHHATGIWNARNNILGGVFAVTVLHGKYAKEHARALHDITKAEQASYARQHAQALKDITKAGDG